MAIIVSYQCVKKTQLDKTHYSVVVPYLSFNNF